MKINTELAGPCVKYKTLERRNFAVGVERINAVLEFFFFLRLEVY